MKATFIGMIAAAPLLVGSAQASSLYNFSDITDPVVLSSGQTLANIPDGYDSNDYTSRVALFRKTYDYTFADGLSIALGEVVHRYADSPSVAHPGIEFSYELTIQSGTLDSFTVGGWTGLSTYVKVCSLEECGNGAGSNGVAPVSVSRASSGDEVTWKFDNFTTYSGTLNIYTDAQGYRDPLAFFADAAGHDYSVDIAGPSLSAVPLPASAPMFGAAILALGAIGYGLKRKKTTAAV